MHNLVLPDFPRGVLFPEALGSERPVVRVKALKPYHSPLICESLLTMAVLGKFCPKSVYDKYQI